MFRPHSGSPPCTLPRSQTAPMEALISPLFRTLTLTETGSLQWAPSGALCSTFLLVCRRCSQRYSDKCMAFQKRTVLLACTISDCFKDGSVCGVLFVFIQTGNLQALLIGTLVSLVVCEKRSAFNPLSAASVPPPLRALGAQGCLTPFSTHLLCPFTSQSPSCFLRGHPRRLLLCLPDHSVLRV